MGRRFWDPEGQQATRSRRAPLKGRRKRCEELFRIARALDKRRAIGVLLWP